MKNSKFEISQIKKAKLEGIIKKYKLYSLRLLRHYDFTEEEIKEYRAYKERFERCLATLEDFEAKCILNTFVEPKFYWWENYYSDAQYYRYRAKALNNFVINFYKNR